MKHFVKLLCITFFSIYGIACYAQAPIQKSKEKARINGEIYYIHNVKEKETLYSLSKAYEVSVEQISKDNPELKEGLKEGQNIRILATPTVQSSQKTVEEKQVEKPIEKPAIAPEIKKEENKQASAYYVVKPGETVWSISQKHGTTPDELRKLNPDAFPNGELMSGALLQLPVSSKSEKTTVTILSDTTTEHQTIAKKQEFFSYLDLSNNIENSKPILFLRPIKASLILPIIPSGNIIDYTIADSLLVDLSSAKSKNVENFYAFYEGALLAVEELKEQGLSLELSVYDSYNKKNVSELISRKKLSGEDIVFGPIYASNLKPVAQFTKEHHIKTVSPLDPNAEELTHENPYLFQLSPPVYCRQKKLIDDVLSQKNTNIILVYDAEGNDSLLVESYKNLLGDRSKNVKFLAHQVKKGIAVRSELAKLMESGKINCVLVASNQEALVSDIAANLYLLTFRDRFSVILYGTERWRNFETIDLKYFHALSLHLVVPFFVDYENENVKNFVARFQNIYKSDPSQYAFQGYDMFYYFLQAMMTYGSDFQNYLNNYHPVLLQTNYRFKYNGGTDNGLVNVESNLIIYTPSYTIVKQ